MKLNGYVCDCGCGETAQTESDVTRPAGWLLVYAGKAEMIHVASWECLAKVAAQRTGIRSIRTGKAI